MSLVQQLLGEARPSRASEVAGLIGKIPGFEAVDTIAQSDGYSMLLRSEDGQAYEIQIRPAAYAKHPSLNRNYGSGRGTVRKPKAPAAPAV
jgi:hypothetical protein